jgi:hypothetical protein
VFQTVTATGAGQGLCGNITVGSLAQAPVPQSLASGGSVACSRGYTFCGVGMPVGPTCNSLLDVIVGGCQALGGLVTVINPTQPDVGGAANLTLGAQNKVILTAATMNLAYSSAFTFAASRAHFTGETCQQDSECQVGQACSAGVCQ